MKNRKVKTTKDRRLRERCLKMALITTDHVNAVRIAKEYEDYITEERPVDVRVVNEMQPVLVVGEMEPMVSFG